MEQKLKSRCLRNPSPNNTQIHLKADLISPDFILPDSSQRIHTWLIVETTGFCCRQQLSELKHDHYSQCQERGKLEGLQSRNNPLTASAPCLAGQKGPQLAKPLGVWRWPSLGQEQLTLNAGECCLALVKTPTWDCPSRGVQPLSSRTGHAEASGSLEWTLCVHRSSNTRSTESGYLAHLPLHVGSIQSSVTGTIGGNPEFQYFPLQIRGVLGDGGHEVGHVHYFWAPCP